ncbi:hypothetical protein ACPWT1_02265 [Ramlibacter sp. MMS24-I3-19]|uniref:hypothetical protein n=1 Tax=Ramlibacter sp. MMS24-I3-19 TaxID=3416606 RepID=UPI003CFC047F
MKHTLIALACTLAVAGGTAFAQDRSSTDSTHESVGQKTKDAAHRAGDKTRHMVHKGEHKMSKARSHHDRNTAQAADSRAMGASSSPSSSDSDRQARMDQAYEDYKSGRGASQTR